MILDCLFNLARFPPQSFEMDPPPLIYLTSFCFTPPYPRVMHCFASSLTISPPSKRRIDESLALYGTPHKGAIICVGLKINSGNEKKIKSELMSNFVLSQTRSLGIRHGRAFMWRHSPFTTIVPAEWMVVKLHVGQRTPVMRAQCFISEWILCFVTGTVYIGILG